MAGFCNSLWRWISGILGVSCILLIAALGMLLWERLFHNTSDKSTISPGTNTKFQKDSDCCFCQNRWIGYQCNCYFISSDTKTWEESRDFCAFQNSTLLHLHKRDELNFMRYNEYFYWIGASYSADHKALMWLNGSAVSWYQLPLPQAENPVKCLAYSPSQGVSDDTCEKTNLYILTDEIIYSNVKYPCPSEQERRQKIKITRKNLLNYRCEVNWNLFNGEGHPAWKYLTCSNNWHQFGENCYFFSKNNCFWKNCAHYCTGLNASFVKVDTEEEMNFVLILAKVQCEMRQENIFISLSYNSKQQKWVWLDGTDLTLDKLEILEHNSTDNECIHINYLWVIAEDCQRNGYCVCKKTVY